MLNFLRKFKQELRSNGIYLDPKQALIIRRYLKSVNVYEVPHKDAEVLRKFMKRCEELK
jgi:hypothetical protein